MEEAIIANIAARLQTLASAGGVCLSGVAYDQVRKILPFAFADLGAQQVKNIDEPVRAFSVVAERAAVVTASENASVPLALPDKPSIAVLPFQNMSGDPEQEYFADGIVEDIITALSRFKSMFVIARTLRARHGVQGTCLRRVNGWSCLRSGGRSERRRMRCLPLPLHRRRSRPQSPSARIH